MSLPQNGFVNGGWSTPLHGDPVTVLDPATEEPLGSVAGLGAGDVEAVCTGAAEGFEVWRDVSAWDRSAVLRRIADILRRDQQVFAAVMTAEQGKPLAQSAGETAASADQFDWYADEARRVYGRIVPGHLATDRIHVYAEPIGPVLAFAPWNFPLLLPARKVAGALAAGCSVILAAPPEAPYCSLLLAGAAAEAGLPPGVLTVVTGDWRTLAGTLVDHPAVRKVTVTSSVPVGIELAVRAAGQVKPITLELGGHSPVIVTPGRGVAEAARACALGKFRNGGQVCIAASRFFVARAALEEFLDVFVATTSSLRLGPGDQEGVDVGPLASAARRSATESLVADAVAQGAKVVAGGRRPAEFDRGYYFEPTVLTDLSPQMAVMTREPFGPIAPIAPYDDLEHAVAQANSTEYGLAGFVFTDDLEAGLRIARRLEVGMVGINNLTVATAEAPFGGVKHSGHGREGGSEGIGEFLVTKYVSARMPDPAGWAG